MGRTAVTGGGGGEVEGKGLESFKFSRKCIENYFTDFLS